MLYVFLRFSFISFLKSKIISDSDRIWFRLRHKRWVLRFVGFGWKPNFWIVSTSFRKFSKKFVTGDFRPSVTYHEVHIHFAVWGICTKICKPIYIKLPRYKVSTFQKIIFWNCRNYSSRNYSSMSAENLTFEKKPKGGPLENPPVIKFSPPLKFSMKCQSFRQHPGPGSAWMNNQEHKNNNWINLHLFIA